MIYWIADEVSIINDLSGFFGLLPLRTPPVGPAAAVENEAQIEQIKRLSGV